MADPVQIAVSLEDAAGGRKSYVYYGASDLDLAGAQTTLTNSAPKLDAVTDARIVRASVFFPLTLPGGLKSSAVDDQRVREGALLSYSADGTAFRFSSYVPGWKTAGFAADSDVVLNSGAYATFISDLLNYSNDDAAALIAFLEGHRTFRK